MGPAASLQLPFENALPLFAFVRWLFYAVVVFYYAKRGKVWPVVVASMAFYAQQNLPAPGDAAFLQGMYEKAERRIWASEPFAHLLLTQTITPQTLRLFLPPLMGGLSVWLWLRLPQFKNIARPEAPLKHDGRDLSLRGMLIAAIPLQMVFYRGYIETIMIAVPAGLLFLRALFRTKAFVPFAKDAANPFIAYTFGSWNHIVAVFSILVYAAPLLLPMLVMRTFRMLRMPPPSLREVMSPADVALLLLTGAFAGFITLWNFDLGFFFDFDLIFSLSIPLALLTERLWSAPPAPAVLFAVMQTLLWMLAFSRFFKDA